MKKSGKRVLRQRLTPPRVKLGPGSGILHTTITRNNTLLTLTDYTGDVLTWTSCKNCGFLGSQKATEIATVTTAEEMGNRIHDLKIRNIYLIFHGGSRFRHAVLRGLRRAERGISSPIRGLIIKNNTPYNGCRLKKKRRT